MSDNVLDDSRSSNTIYTQILLMEFTMPTSPFILFLQSLTTFRYHLSSIWELSQTIHLWLIIQTLNLILLLTLHSLHSLFYME